MVDTPAGPQVVQIGLTSGAGTDNTTISARHIGIDAYVRVQQLAAARADASANGHHPDPGGPSESEILAAQNGATSSATVANTAIHTTKTTTFGSVTTFNVQQNCDRDHQSGTTYDHTATEDRRPIRRDLNGNGVEVATLGRSGSFVDANGDGLQHRTAWAMGFCFMMRGMMG